jgi:hypothetical protein
MATPDQTPPNGGIIFFLRIPSGGSGGREEWAGKSGQPGNSSATGHPRASPRAARGS